MLEYIVIENWFRNRWDSDLTISENMSVAIKKFGIIFIIKNDLLILH